MNLNKFLKENLEDKNLDENLKKTVELLSNNNFKILAFYLIKNKNENFNVLLNYVINNLLLKSKEKIKINKEQLNEFCLYIRDKIDFLHKSILKLNFQVNDQSIFENILKSLIILKSKNSFNINDLEIIFEIYWLICYFDYFYLSLEEEIWNSIFKYIVSMKLLSYAKTNGFYITSYVKKHIKL